MIQRMLTALAVVVSLVTVATQLQAQNEADVVAEVGGTKLTLADLEQKESSSLLQPRYQYYQAQRAALDKLVENQLLETQARRENVSVEELLKRHVESQVKDATDDQLAVYYEGVETDQPFSVMRDKIREHIRKLRLGKARAAYIESLRKDLGVTIALAPPTADVPLGDSPVRGPRNAPVRIIEFADYQCPYCQKVNPDVKKLELEFAGKLTLAFRDFPLAMHDHAEKAAEAARCAGDQGKFWEFHDLLFDNGGRLEPSDLKEYARSLKLDATRFDSCLDSGAQAAAVQKDVAQGKALGLAGTPSFFVNGHFISGAVDHAALRAMVEQELATASAAAQSAENQGKP